MTAGWCHIQGHLFPCLRAEVEPLTEQHERLVTVLEMARVEAFVRVRGAGKVISHLMFAILVVTVEHLMRLVT